MQFPVLKPRPTVISLAILSKTTHKRYVICWYIIFYSKTFLNDVPSFLLPIYPYSQQPASRNHSTSYKNVIRTMNEYIYMCIYEYFNFCTFPKRIQPKKKKKDCQPNHWVFYIWYTNKDVQRVGGGVYVMMLSCMDPLCLVVESEYIFIYMVVVSNSDDAANGGFGCGLRFYTSLLLHRLNCFFI